MADLTPDQLDRLLDGMQTYDLDGKVMPVIDELIAAAVAREQARTAAEALRTTASAMANTTRPTVPLAAVLATLYEVADSIEAEALTASPG